jgi:hypothetical protein
MPLLLFALLLLASPLIAAERTVWTIGVEDGSSREFGRAVRWSDPKDEVVFRVGQSQPAKDWPAMHPGPSNAAANGQPRAYTIVFHVEGRPAASYVLSGSFLFKRPRYPSLLVEINGRKGQFFFHPQVTIEAGDNDGLNAANYATQKIDIPFPGAWLKPGENRMALSCLDDPPEVERGANSSVFYDFLKLTAADEPFKPQLEARLLPTVFYVRPKNDPGRVAEIAELIISADRKASGTATVRLGEKTFSQQLSPAYDFGEQRYELLLPELAGSTPAEIRLETSAGKRAIRAEITPARKWKIYMAPHMHLDIGYTDLQAKVAELMSRNMDVLVDMLRANPDFRYNIDGSWQVQQFLAGRSPQQQKEFLELARRGQVGLNAWYLNLLIGGASPEELMRSAYYSYELHKKHGYPYAVMNLTDVPSAPASLASFLSATGIKYFVSGANQERGPILVNGGERNLNRLGPYWWQGPDGKRVLMWYSRTYHQVLTLLGVPPGMRAARDSFSRWIGYYDRPDYRSDAVLIYGTQIENRSVTNESDFPKQWNAAYEWPRVIPCRMEEFFEYVEKNFGNQLPVVKGDGGGYWEDGLGTIALSTIIHRRNQQRILAAETLTGLMSAMTPRLSPPLEDLRRAWELLLLYTEHTITADVGTSQPEAEQSLRQTQFKTAHAPQAAALIDSTMLRGLSQLGAQIDTDQDTLLVFNPLSWERGGLVEIDLNDGRALRDLAANQNLPLETLSAQNGYRRVRFYAERVPPAGYKLYGLVAERNVAATSRSPSPGPGDLKVAATSAATSNVIENRFYRVTIDPARAAVTSIFDKELNSELVDSKSVFGLNQYVYVSGGGSEQGRGAGPEATQLVYYNRSLPYANLEIAVAKGAGAPRLLETAYGKRLQLKAGGPHTQDITTEVALYDTEKRIDFINRFQKERVWAKEAVYFAFPLAVRAPIFRYESQNGWVNPAEDQLPGACNEWFAVQNWVNVSNAELSVTLSTPDAPLVTLGDINRGRWPTTFQPASPTVFSYALNNYWHTNVPAGQSGEFQFRYSLTSGRAFDPVAAGRLGREAGMPLERNVIGALDRSTIVRGPITEPRGSLVSIDAPNVVLLTWKKAEDGNGFIARLLETGGRKTDGRLRVSRIPIRQAFLATGVEENLRPLAATADAVPFSIDPFEVLTVRVVVAGGRR